MGDKMKVTIDTKEDSHEDVRKVLHILTSILERKDLKGSNNETEVADTTSMMSMFDTPDKQAAETRGTAPDFTSFLNLQNNSSKKEDKEKNSIPKIEYF